MGRYVFFVFFLCLGFSLWAEPVDELVSWNPRIPGKQVGNAPSNPKNIPKKEAPPKILNSHLSVGANYSYVHISQEGNRSWTGNLAGAQALYEFKPMNRVYIGFSAAWRQGNTHQSAGDIFLLELDGQDRIGYTWGSFRKRRMLSLFSGIGFRRLDERVKAFSQGSTVTFNYNELYIPVGMLIQGSLHPLVSCGLNVQWMPQVYPTLTIVPLKGARWILSNKIANFRGELPLNIYTTRSRKFSFCLKPFFEFWQNGHTSARTQLGTVLHVSGNTYLFGGLDLDLRYSF